MESCQLLLHEPDQNHISYLLLTLCFRGLWRDRWPGRRYLLLITLLACTFPWYADFSNSWNWSKPFGSCMCHGSREPAVPWHCLPQVITCCWTFHFHFYCPLCNTPVLLIQNNTYFNQTAFTFLPPLLWRGDEFVSVFGLHPFPACLCSPSVPHRQLHKISLFFPLNLTGHSWKWHQIYTDCLNLYDSLVPS